MPVSKRDQILLRVALNECLKEIGHWFGRFDRGFGATITREDVDGLLELLALRDELRREEEGIDLQALPEVVPSDVVDEPVRFRSFVGMGM